MFAISFFDLFVGCVLGNAQDLVVVSFSHGLSVPGFNTNAAVNLLRCSTRRPITVFSASA
jgi:hypothetical protein